jgi:hypothetical protein
VASIFFFAARAKLMPRVQPDKTLRWDYDYVEYGDVELSYMIELDDYYMPARSDDEWTVGESSSIASHDSRERSPSVASGENDSILWAKKDEP